MRASKIMMTNHSKATQKLWIFDSDGSAREGLTLSSGTSGSVTLKNQHIYFVYSVGFGKVGEWNASNPDEQLDPNELGALLLDVDLYPRSEVRWDVVSLCPSEVIQGSDQSTPASFSIERD